VGKLRKLFVICFPGFSSFLSFDLAQMSSAFAMTNRSVLVPLFKRKPSALGIGMNNLQEIHRFDSIPKKARCRTVPLFTQEFQTFQQRVNEIERKHPCCLFERLIVTMIAESALIKPYVEVIKQ